MKKAKRVFILGEILTIDGIDYCNGFAVSPDVQYLLDYKSSISGSGHFKIGIIIGKDVKLIWYGDVIETVTPCMVISCNG